MALRPVTTWYRWNPKKQRWEYNHFEFGTTLNSQPTPESDRQVGVWPKARWAKRFGFYQNALGHTRVVEESKLLKCNINDPR